MKPSPPLGLLLLLALGSVACNAAEPTRSGFLGDYSKLDTEVEDGMTFVAPGNRIADYNQFLFEDVAVRGGDPADPAWRDLQVYARVAFGDAVRQATGRHLTTALPGPGVAIIRIAITEDNPELRRPTACLEAEILDSVTGEQLLAAVLAQRHANLSLATFEMRGAKRAIDDWAERFRDGLRAAYAE